MKTPHDSTSQMMGSIEVTVDHVDDGDDNPNSNGLRTDNLPQSNISILVESPRDARFSHFDPRQL